MLNLEPPVKFEGSRRMAFDAPYDHLHQQ